MSSAQVNAVPQAQKYGEKRGKSGKEMLNRYRELLKERGAIQSDAATVSTSFSSSFSSFDESQKETENQTSHDIVSGITNKNPFQSVLADVSNNLSVDATKIGKPVKEQTSNNICEEGTTLNNSNAVEMVTDDNMNTYVSNESNNDCSQSDGHVTYLSEETSIKAGNKSNANDPINLELSQTLSLDIHDTSVPISQDISGLSQILNSSYSEEYNVNDNFNSNQTFDSESKFQLSLSTNVSNDFLVQNQVAILPNNSNIIMDETQIERMNESLISFPVSVHSDTSKIYTPQKLLETSLIVSDDDDEQPQTHNCNDSASQSMYLPPCNSITETSISPELFSPMTPLTAMRRNSVQLALADSKAYMETVEQLSKALEKAENEKKKEAKRRLECENIIKNMSSVQPGTPQSNTTEKNNLNTSVVVSPVSKVLSLEDSMTKSMNQDSQYKYNSTASSLMERNMTLVKEVRFADQTCIELSEKNQALEQTSAHLQKELSSAKKEIKRLHDNVVNAEKYGTKVEASRDSVLQQLNQQKTHFESELQVLRNNLVEAKVQVESWKNQADKQHSEKQTVEKKLSTSNEKIDVLSSELMEAKETIAGLTERLSAQQNISKSPMEKYNKMKLERDELHRLYETSLKQVEDEKERNRVLTLDRNYLEGQLVCQLSQSNDENEKSNDFDSYGEESHVVSSQNNDAALEIITRDRDMYASRAKEWESKATELKCQLDSCTPREKVLELEASLDISRKQIVVLQQKLDKKIEDAGLLQRELKNMASHLNKCENEKEKIILNAASQTNLERIVEEHHEKNIKLENAILQIEDVKDELDNLHVLVSSQNVTLGDQTLALSLDENKMRLNLSEISSLVDKITYRLRNCLSFQNKQLHSEQETSGHDWDLRSVENKVNRSADDFESVSPKSAHSRDSFMEVYDNVLDATFSCNHSESQLDDSRLIVLLEEARNSIQRNNFDVESSPKADKFVQYTTAKISRLREELKRSDISRDDIENDYESLLLMLDEANAKMGQYKEFVSHLQDSHLIEQRTLLNEVSSLNQNINLIKKEKERIEKAAEENEENHLEEVQNLFNEITQLKTEINQHRGSLHEVEEENKMLEKENSRLSVVEKENIRSMEKLSSMQEKTSELKCEIERLRNVHENLSAKEKHIKSLEEQIYNLQENINEFHDFESKWHESQRRCKDVEEIAVDLKEQNDCLEDKCAEIFRTLDANATEIQELHADNRASNLLQENLAKENNIKREKILELQQSLSAANTNLQDSNESIGEMSRNLQERKREVNDLTLKYKNVLSQLEELRSEYNENDARWQKAVKEKDSLFSEFQELSINEQHLLKQTHEEKIGKMDFEMSQMEQRITLLESELAATKFDAANEAAKHTSVTTELHKLRKSLKKAEEDKTILENELTSTLGDFDRLNTKYEKKVKRLSALLQDLSKAKDSATFELMKKEEHLNQINNELDVASSKLRSHKEKVEDSESNAGTAGLLEQARQKNESLERKCVRLREYIAKLTKKCEEWADSYRALSNDFKKSKQDKINLVDQIECLAFRKSCTIDTKSWQEEKKSSQMISNITGEKIEKEGELSEDSEHTSGKPDEIHTIPQDEFTRNRKDRVHDVRTRSNHAQNFVEEGNCNEVGRDMMQLRTQVDNEHSKEFEWKQLRPRKTNMSSEKTHVKPRYYPGSGNNLTTKTHFRIEGNRQNTV